MKYWITVLVVFFCADYIFRIGYPVETAKEISVQDVKGNNNVAKSTPRDLSEVYITLWGGDAGPDDQTPDDSTIFDIATPDSIKALGDKQFLLYALIEQKNKVQGLIWVKDLKQTEDNTSLEPVFLGSNLGELSITSLDMSGVKISDGNNEISLEIFKRVSNE